MATLTKSNLFSESYDIVKTFLESISGLDVRKRFKSIYIHPSMPNVNAKGFSGYPFIVVQSSVTEEDKSFDFGTSSKQFDILITVYSDEPTEVDDMCDLIFDNFRDTTKMTEFKARQISSSPFDWNMDQNGKKISFRSLGFIMKVRF